MQQPISSIQRNNLDQSLSLYLRQHQENPVWWQEWTPQILERAQQSGKPLLVSVGYATCHWCHVMANGAFSDPQTAAFLNAHFICIKVDRELRPDLDQYWMAFLQAQQGAGGWPLNVFLYPDQKPLLALTYAPVESTPQHRGFLDIAQQVWRYIQENPEGGFDFVPPEDSMVPQDRSVALERLLSFYDSAHGGFGSTHKFPPHSVLIAQLYHEAAFPDERRRQMLTGTLRAMRRKGLYDHLQGGLFRYCVDASWTVPHFEKMLYDQALGLWEFALAFRVLGDPEDREAARGMARCLQESFAQEGFYVTAHDADTHHIEGDSYLWDYSELRRVLGPDGVTFFENYAVSPLGNFEGRNHLHWTGEKRVPLAESRLLEVRRLRDQPQVDTKILSGQNAWVVCAFLNAARCLDEPTWQKEGLRLLRVLWDSFWNGHDFLHARVGSVVWGGPYLADAATMLLAVTYAMEEEEGWEPMAATLEPLLMSFFEEGRWLESRASDWMNVPAQRLDHPMPSSVATAELALARLALLRGEVPPLEPAGDAYAQAFGLLTHLLVNNDVHWVKGMVHGDWAQWPVHTLRIRGAGEASDCYQGVCRLLPEK